MKEAWQGDLGRIRELSLENPLGVLGLVAGSQRPLLRVDFHSEDINIRHRITVFL